MLNTCFRRHRVSVPFLIRAFLLHKKKKKKHDINSHQLHLSSPVCQIFWDRPEDDKSLVVLADGSSYMADYVISTIPLGALKEHHYRTFFPALPRTLTSALDSVDAGVVNRIVLGYELSWWGPKPFSQQVLWKDYNFPLEMEWMSNIVSIRSNPERPMQLEMEVFGDAAVAMENLSTESVIAHLINFLRTTKPEYTVPVPTFFHRSKWSRNPFMKGSYHSYMNMDPVTTLYDRSSLCPIVSNGRGKKSLFFAGEHTSTDRYSTLDGGLLSGARAARWVMDERATQENLIMVVNGERRSLLPLDDEKLKIDYYQFFKNPTLAYQGALEISEAMEMEKKQIQMERKRSKKERKASKKAAKEKRKQQKKNKKPETNYSNEQVTTGHENLVSAENQELESQTRKPELIQKRSRIAEPHFAEQHPHHPHSPISKPHSSIPVSSTTLTLTPSVQSYPLQSSVPSQSQHGPMFHGMMPSTEEHFMAEHSGDVSVVYLNTDGYHTDYNSALKSGDSNEVSVVYLDGQANQPHENGNPSVVYVEGPLSPQFTSLVDALTVKNSKSQTQPSVPRESESLVTKSNDRKKAKKNKNQKESRKDVVHEVEKLSPADKVERKSVVRGKSRSESLKKKEKQRRNQKKGSKKKNNRKENDKKKKRINKNQENNEKQTREDASKGKTHTPLESNVPNPYFPFTGVNSPYYFPYHGMHPIDHLSFLSRSMMPKEMKEKESPDSLESSSLERRRRKTEENVSSLEITTTIRPHSPESVASSTHDTSEPGKFYEPVGSTNDKSHGNVNILDQGRQEHRTTFPQKQSIEVIMPSKIPEVQPMNSFQSRPQGSQSQESHSFNKPTHQTIHSSMSQNPAQGQQIHSLNVPNHQTIQSSMSQNPSQSQQIHSLNVPNHQTVHSSMSQNPAQSQQVHSLNVPHHETVLSTMSQNPTQSNINSNSFLSQHNQGNMYPVNQHIPSAPNKATIHSNNQQNIQHFHDNSQPNGNFNLQNTFLPNYHSPPSYSSNNQDNHFRQDGINHGFAMNSDSSLTYGANSQMPHNQDYSFQLNQYAANQQPFRGNPNMNMKSSLENSAQLDPNSTENNTNRPIAAQVSGSLENTETETSTKTRTPSQERDVNVSKEQNTEANVRSPGKKRNRQRPNKHAPHKGRYKNSFINRHNNNNWRQGQQPFIIIPESSHLLLRGSNYEERTSSKPKEVESSEVTTPKEKHLVSTEKIENDESSKEKQKIKSAEIVTETPKETEAVKSSLQQTENDDDGEKIGSVIPSSPETLAINRNPYIQGSPHQQGYPIVPSINQFPFFYPMPYYNPYMKSGYPFPPSPTDRYDRFKSLEVTVPLPSKAADPIVNTTKDKDLMQTPISSSLSIDRQNDTQTASVSNIPKIQEPNPSNQNSSKQMPHEKDEALDNEMAEDTTIIQKDEEYQVTPSSKERQRRNAKKAQSRKPRLLAGIPSEEIDKELHNTASEKEELDYDDIPLPFDSNF